MIINEEDAWIIVSALRRMRLDGGGFAGNDLLGRIRVAYSKIDVYMNSLERKEALSMIKDVEDRAKGNKILVLVCGRLKEEIEGIFPI